MLFSYDTINCEMQSIRHDYRMQRDELSMKKRILNIRYFDLNRDVIIKTSPDKPLSIREKGYDPEFSVYHVPATFRDVPLMIRRPTPKRIRPSSVLLKVIRYNNIGNMPKIKKPIPRHIPVN